MKGNHEKQLVMIGPDLNSRGGVSSVCLSYLRAGFFDQLNVRYLPSFREGGGLYKLAVAIQCATQLLWLVACRRVRGVHLHVASGSSVWRKLALAVVARAFSVPYVLHLHSGKLQHEHDVVYGRVRRVIWRDFLRASAGVAYLTSDQKRWLDRSFPEVGVLIRIPNFVRCPAARAEHGAVTKVLYLGRLEEQKGLSVLLKAAAIVQKSFQNFELSIGGEGDTQRYLSMVRSLGLEERVRFLGWIDEDRRSRLMQEASLFVLPSMAEGLSMALLEAMSNGLACVASDVGGNPDIISDGENGLLVRANDPVALADAIERLVGDKGFAAALSTAARATVMERFSERNALMALERLHHCEASS